MAKKTTPKTVGDRVPEADFRFFLAAQAAGDTEGRPTITVTASSSDIDLTHDRFAKSALRQMQKAFGGMTIFLNHRYAIPEDVFGTVRKATLTGREGHTDLDLIIAVDDTSPRAMQTFAMIKNGTRLGVSIGVLVVDADYLDEEVDGRRVMEITDVIPLEASIVGIPANRRSWVQNALKAAGLLADKSGMTLHRSRVEGPADDEEEDMRLEDFDPRFDLSVAEEEDEEEAEEDLEITGVDDDEEDDDADEDDIDVGALYSVTFASEAVRIHSLVDKTVVGSHTPATNERDQAWSGRAAIGRIRKWASSDGSGSKEKVAWKKYRRGFVWYDSENTENFGGYKAPHHDIIDSTFKTHFRGCAAAAVVISGGRGGLSIPEGDVAGVKRHIATHYHQYDEKAPWERDKGAAWLPIEIEVAKELGIMLDPHEDQKGGGNAPDLVDELVGVAYVGDLGVIIDEDAVPPEEARKSLADEVAAENFIDKVWTIWRAFYYRIYDILASEEDIGSKRSEGQKVIKEFSDLLLEAFGEILEDLGDADDKTLLETLRLAHLIIAQGSDAPAQLLELMAKTEALSEAHEKLQEEKAALVTESDEAKALATQCLAAVNEVMEMPLARKIVPEEIVAGLRARFPNLAPSIVSELARRAAASGDKIG